MYKTFGYFSLIPNINKIVATRYLEQLDSKARDSETFDQTPPEILKYMVEEENSKKSFSKKLDNFFEAIKIKFIDFFYHDNKKIDKLIFIYNDLKKIIENNPEILYEAQSLEHLYYHNKSDEYIHWLLRLHAGNFHLPFSRIWSDYSDGSKKVIFRDLSEILKIKNSEPIYIYNDEDNNKVKITIKETYKYIIDEILKDPFENTEKDELKDLLNHILDKKIRKNFIEKSKEYVYSLPSEHEEIFDNVENIYLNIENKESAIDFLKNLKEEEEEKKHLIINFLNTYTTEKQL